MWNALSQQQMKNDESEEGSRAHSSANMKEIKKTKKKMPWLKSMKKKTANKVVPTGNKQQQPLPVISKKAVWISVYYELGIDARSILFLVIIISDAFYNTVRRLSVRSFGPTKLEKVIDWQSVNHKYLVMTGQTTSEGGEENPEQT